MLKSSVTQSKNLKQLFNDSFKLPKRETERSVSELIHTLFKKHNIDEKLFEQQILNSWEAIIGKTIARHTTSLYVNNRVLHLAVNAAALKAELLITKTQIINKVNEYLKSNFISDIIIR